MRRIEEVAAEVRELLGKPEPSRRERRQYAIVQAEFLQQCRRLVASEAQRLARLPQALLEEDELLEVAATTGWRLLVEGKLRPGYEAPGVIVNGRRDMRRALTKARGVSVVVMELAGQITEIRDHQPYLSHDEIVAKLGVRVTDACVQRAERLVERKQLRYRLDPDGQRTEEDLVREVAQGIAIQHRRKQVFAAQAARAQTRALSIDEEDSSVVLTAEDGLKIDRDWQVLHGPERLVRTLQGLSSQPALAAQALALVGAVLKETPGETGLARLAGRPNAPLDIIIGTIPAERRAQAVTAIRAYAADPIARVFDLRTATQPALWAEASTPDQEAVTRPARPARRRVRRVSEQVAVVPDLFRNEADKAGTTEEESAKTNVMVGAV